MNNRVKIAHEFANAINSDKIVRIILFGSVARGDDTEDSDIDILIVSDYWEEIDSIITDVVGDIVLDQQELISSKILFENQQYATSVSASYYCMFLTAKALLRECPEIHF